MAADSGILGALSSVFGTVASILASLGINETFIYQFGIFAVFFVVAKVLFLNNLQFNLENRLSKTTKLSGKAEELFKEADKLSEQYRSSVEQTYREFQSKMSAQKDKIKQNNEKELRKVEKEIQAYLDESKEKTQTEVKSVEKNLLAQKDQLSGQLVEKIIQ